MRGAATSPAGARAGAAFLACALACVPVRGAAAEPAAQPTVVSLAEMVGAGVISTGGFELAPAFHPDGRTFYFVKAAPSFMKHAHFTVVLSRLTEGRWTRPEIAPFSGRFSDLNPWLSADGRRFYFASDRPVGGREPGDFNLWMMTWERGGWTEPAVLPHPVNSDADELSVSDDDEGTLYFDSNRAGGAGSWDLYRSRRDGAVYGPAENLEELNTSGADVTPAVSRDGTSLLFSSSDRLGRGTEGDLYISYRGERSWKAPEPLDAVNTTADETHPRLSPDGRYLYFTSDRPFRIGRSEPSESYDDLEERLGGPGNGLGDIYRILVRHLGIELR